VAVDALSSQKQSWQALLSVLSVLSTGSRRKSLLVNTLEGNGTDLHALAKRLFRVRASQSDATIWFLQGRPCCGLFFSKVYWFCSLPEAKATEFLSGKNLMH